MVKTYQTPDPHERPEKNAKPEKTVGIYERPARKGLSREVLIAIGVAILLVIIFLLVRMAQGELYGGASVERAGALSEVGRSVGDA